MWCALLFGAELFAVTGAVDSSIPVLVTLQEFTHGPLALTEARRLREEGGWAFRAVVVTDNMGLFQALASFVAKLPTEKSLSLQFPLVEGNLAEEGDHCLAME